MTDHAVQPLCLEFYVGQWRLVGRYHSHLDGLGCLIQEGMFEGPPRGVFDLAEQAIRGIEEGVQAEAALRQLWASLAEFRHLHADEPGIRMAAQDLY